ncbi:RnfABCDGE type electron transport complex subunit G [Pseudothermotoga thermarum]|uniref:Ion-translocating oxidoreductase complex subunit G n=1 Tax=Pseudothermotoga thermarum DSM 5069 TaxID=688269 RepID=F7YUE9_9THEM|nr:RnfABCDGE type electron transport complex subunit G [Pseudothermotoga thermarum]AEH51350.1 electron transport complex, RnfABCDGE type, G subunit [Pseudothermotoga thermarum DSM 5069]
MKEYMKMGLILLAYCAIAGFALGIVYVVTRDRILLAELSEKLQAIETVLKDDKGNYITSLSEIKAGLEAAEGEGVIFSDPFGKVYAPVYKFKSPLGDIYVLTGSGIGYGGEVKVVASFIKKPEGFELFSVRVTEYAKETPGLGARIGEEEVQRRFYPMPAEAIKNGILVDVDARATHLSPEEAKKKGIAKISDVMTGATITSRAVADALTVMIQYLYTEVLK